MSFNGSNEKNLNNEEYEPNVEMQEYLSFLAGKMNPEEARTFADECFDDPEKFEKLKVFKGFYEKIKEVFKDEEEKLVMQKGEDEKNIVKDLLKGIYGIQPSKD